LKGCVVGLPRDTVKLFRNIALDTFAPNATERLRQLPDAMPLLEELDSSEAIESPANVLLFALQALAVQEAERPRETNIPEFVATLPAGLWSSARPTPVVIREMLANAKREVVVFGYMITESTGIMPLLHRAAATCPYVLIVCDRESQSAVSLLREWPSYLSPPTILVNRATENISPTSKMYSKMLLVDGKDLLVTSANLTFHGLESNIEFGVRLHGQVASEARLFVDHLRELKLLEPYASQE